MAKKLADVLDDEQVVLLRPQASLEAFAGSYNAMRAMADQVATSSMRSQLPAAWQHLVANPVTDTKTTIERAAKVR